MGFKTKLIVGMACLLSIAIVILSLFNYLSVKLQAEKDAYALFNATIHGVAVETEAWAKDFIDVGQSAITGLGNITTPEGAQAALPALKTFMQDHGYDDFLIALEDHSTYVAPSGQVIPADWIYYEQIWYTEAKRTGKPYITAPFYSPTAFKMQFGIAIPIFDEYNKFAGVLGIFTGFEKLETVLEGYNSQQLDGNLTIIDNTHTIIATPPADKADVLQKIEEANAGLASFTAQINNPNVSVIKYENKGVSKLYFQQQLRGFDGYVSFRVDESAVLAEANKALTISALISLGILVFSLVFMFFLLRVLFRPIAGLRDLIVDLGSGEADLTKRLNIKTKDELGEIAGSMNGFISNLQSIITEVKVASEDVASGNTQLAATMEQLSATFNMQAEQVSSVASNMGVMNSTSQGIVGTVQDGISAMTSAGNAVQNGNVELQGVMRTMESVKGQTSQLSGTINQLSESSVRIGEILNVISNIADQTNLLALNAAIEAARAGEAGRGFAVVADEVRKLAEGTQSSTNEITTIINTLQKDTSNASSEMSATIGSVNLGMNGITQAGEQMNYIVEASDNVHNSLGSINNEVTSQFSMMSSMSDNAQSLAAGIEESVHAIHEVASTVTHLQGEAEALKSIVARFKI